MAKKLPIQKFADTVSSPYFSGAVTLAGSASPVSKAYAGANMASKALTGKTIPEHLKSQIKGPPQSKSNKVGPKKKGKTVASEDVQYDAKQKNILRDNKAKGGLVSYKSVSDLESKHV